MGIFSFFTKKIKEKKQKTLPEGNGNTADITAKANQKPSLDELLNAEPTYDNIRDAIMAFFNETNDFMMDLVSSSTIGIYSKERYEIDEMAKKLATLSTNMSINFRNIQRDDYNEIQRYADVLKDANRILNSTRGRLDRIMIESGAEVFRHNKYVPEGDRITADSYQMDNNRTIEQTKEAPTGWDVSDI